MTADSLRIPNAILDRAQAIIEITEGVCCEHLDDEYGQIARRLVARLARKRPSPLARGDVRIWAAGIICAVGQVNFLFDRTQTPHLTADQLAERLGVVKTTMANQAGLINRTLDIGTFEPDLTRIAMLEQHPIAWLVDVDGLVVDVRTLPATCRPRRDAAASSPTSTRCAAPRATIADLDALIDELTVDAYGDEEQLTGFHVGAGEALRRDQRATIVGVDVEVVAVDCGPDARTGLLARVRRGAAMYDVALADLTLPSDSELALVVAAYRRWQGR